MSERAKQDKGPAGLPKRNEGRMKRAEAESGGDADAIASIKTERQRKREASVSSIDSDENLEDIMIRLWIVQAENEKMRAEGAPPLSTKEEVKMSSKDSFENKTFSQTLMTTTEANESNVKQFRLIPSNMIGDWRVKRVVNPFEIYLEFMFDETIGNGDLAKRNYHSWWPRMQQFYKELVNHREIKMRKEDIRVGLCFVVEEKERKTPSQSKWHRVRVLKLRPEEEKAFIFFCDIGKRGLVHYSRLHKLDPEFAQYGAHLFRCYLYNLIPSTSNKSSLLSWPLKAVTFFKDLMKKYEGNNISGMILARSGTAVQRGLPDVYHNLGMFLFDKSEICSLNALMVKKGYAQATGLFASCPHQLGIGRPEKMERPKFVEEEFRRLHPELYDEKIKPINPPARRDPPNKHFLKSINTDEYNRLVQKYAAVTRPEIKWHSTEYKLKQLKKTQDLKSGWLRPSIQEKVAHVKIKYSRGPHYIILQICSEAKALAEMETAIGRTVEQLYSIRVVEPGQFVACQAVKPSKPNSSKEEEDEEEEYTYLRGMVLSSTDDPQYYKILAVDYGKELLILQSDIYPLTEYFCEIPSFAIRAHLAVPGIFPADAGETGGGWSDPAKQLLVEYLNYWDKYAPQYYAYRPPNAESIELDSLHQEVVFDKGREQWIPGGFPKGARRASGEMRSHPLTRSLLNSIGVCIKYEIKLENTSFWHFEDLHDLLRAKQEAIPVKQARSDARIHLDITDQWLFNVMKQAVKFAG